MNELSARQGHPATEALLRAATPRERVVLALVVLGVLFPTYLVTNHATGGQETATLFTPVDRATPFIPTSIYVYAFVYTFMLLPAFVLRSRALFLRCCAAYVLAYLVAIPVFLAYPVTLPRPVLAIDSFGDWALTLNWYLDEPRNCCPSLHVTIAYLAALCAWQVDRLSGVVAWVVATAIAVSTMLVKQHYLADVLSGAALGYGVWWVCLGHLKHLRRRELRYHRVWALFPLGIFVAVALALYPLYRAGWKPWAK